MKTALAALSLLLAVPSAPVMAQFDVAGFASRLHPGMSISQVLLAIGYRPTSISETTCRQVSGEPFACRLWNYATDLQELQIYFRYDEPQQQWLVYGWRL